MFDIKWSGSLKHTASDAPEGQSGASIGSGPGTAPLLGHAAADGMLYAYMLQKDNTLHTVGCIDCRDSEEDIGTLALSLDWNDKKVGDRVVHFAERRARQSQSLISRPLFCQNGLQAKPGFEMCFDIGSRHLGCWGQNTPPYAQGCDLS